VTESVPDGLLLTRDLMFLSKVTGTAAQLGVRIESVGAVDQLLSRAAASVRVIIVDLGLNDIDLPSLVSGLPAPRPLLIAFGAHVDVDRLASAQAAGFDLVMPRSKFSATLPELLRDALKLPT
jgi:hypothetical protein